VKSDSTSSPRRKPGRWRKAIPWIIALTLVGAIVWGLRPRPIPVDVAQVTSAPLVVSVLEEGKTRIKQRYLVAAPVSGLLRRVNLRAGARIEAGTTVLAEIEPAPAQLLDVRSRAEAEARLQAAQASQQQASAEVERARAALDLARKDWARYKSLLAQKAMAARDADAAQNLVTVNERSLHAAEFAVQVATFQAEQARAALMAPGAEGAAAGEPVRLIAPVDGVVLNVFEESSRPVAAGAQILEIGNPKDLEAEIELLSSDAVAISPGAEAHIEHWGGEQPLRAKVAVVEPGGYTKVSALGVEEQRVKVRIDFVDPLPPNYALGDRYRVEARIITWSGQDVLQVPTGALFRRGNDWMVFLVEGNFARLTKVVISHNNGVAAAVESGLKAGQSVILHPPDTIVDGSAIVTRHL